MTAAEEWSGSPEQADDMTVIVARLGYWVNLRLSCQELGWLR